VTIRSGWKDTPAWPQPPSTLELLSGPVYSSLSLSQITLDNWSAPATSVSLAEPRYYYEWEHLTGQENSVCLTVHTNVFEKYNVIALWACCVGRCSGMPDAVCLLLLITVFFHLATNSRIFQPSLYQIVSHKHARDTEQSSFARLPLELWRPHNVHFFGG
jgi:hypothetical protein